MAENKQGTSSIDQTTFIKGMVKDVDDSYFPEGSWFHLRNGVNNSKDGNEGVIGNEPSNTFCTAAPYTVIGAIHLNDDRWVIHSTNNTDSEIGLFLEDSCAYTRIAVDWGNTCLNYNTNNLIIGVSKENFDCTWQIYYADGRNPDRTLNIDKPPFLENCVVNATGCLVCTQILHPVHLTPMLDCDKLRLSSLMVTPCVTVTKGTTGGNLLNGSYYAVIAYVMNGQRVTDYFTPSNTQALFDHDNVTSSLIVTINQMDTTHFDYYELVIVRTINSQTSAKKMGIYSTHQAQISIDYINEALTSVPVELIPQRTPNYETSDGVFEIGDYMLRTGPRAKFDFNYQPLANHIETLWQAVQYPSDYHAKGGINTSYMRDEVYPFFIRWVYNTGEKSSSYHIPGRPSMPSDRTLAPAGEILPDDPAGIQRWDAINTAIVTTANPAGISTLPDGGVVIAEGLMGYWESTERYPDTKAEVFDSSFPAHPWTSIGGPPLNLPMPYGTLLPVMPQTNQFDLCGQAIRHHKFPSNDTDLTATKITNHFRTSGGLQKIVVMGVKFQNILPPVDNQGNLIPGIVGYEILRGSREGNKTVIAKGIINNMRAYNLDDGSSKVGLYPNYPYNPIGTDNAGASKPAFSAGIDNSLSITETVGGTNTGGSGTPAFDTSRIQFTFHSPDTQFNNPFLSSKELKLYGEVSGQVTGNFDEVPEHPKHKIITDFAFIISSLVGIGAAIFSMRGKNVRRVQYPTANNPGVFGSFAAGTGVVASANVLDVPFQSALLSAPLTATNLASGTTYNLMNSAGSFLVFDIFGFQNPAVTTAKTTAKNLSKTTPGLFGYQEYYEDVSSDQKSIPTVFKVGQAIPTFSHYYTAGTDATLDLIKAAVPFTQYAYRYTSHGLYDVYNQPQTGIRKRHYLTNAIYLGDGMQDFGENGNAKINNVYRSKAVALQTLVSVDHPVSSVDNTIQTIKTCVQGTAGLPTNTLAGYGKDDVKKPFTTNTVCHYTAIKQRMRNQYGQIDAIIQVPASYCSINVGPMTPGTVVPDSGIIFNGDIYIGHYTEKNTFFYFWDWLLGQPDGYEFDYRLRYMVNFPRYWADLTGFDTSEFVRNFVAGIFSLNPSQIFAGIPSKKSRLDGPFISTSSFGSLVASLFRVTDRYFYLFQSGIRDIYVESEINVGMRDWGDRPEQRFYDTGRFTDRRALFDPRIIKSGNYYKYDQSLSISRIFNNFFSWGNVQDRDYDPATAASCYTYYKKRVIYSLPQNLEAKKDFWRVFLANNYKDFKSKITAVEPVNRNGAMFFFEEDAPIMNPGVDTLETDAGTKITIGDGGLFSMPRQNVVNANESYEYGSCQNRLSVANTPVGLFWMSQNQGKIFRYSGELKELSAINMKFWFSRYLPYQLTKDFPNYDILDNPVAGIGCHTIFNNRDTVLYFAKKDFSLKPNLPVTVVYTPGIGFTANNLPIKLGDPLYFDDASWTLSFDPRNETWQSFHDWHPELMLPSKTHHMTTFTDPVSGIGGIWKHTDNQTSFCNFYGRNYPWEIDYVSQTGATVNTLRSIEYIMEAHIYRNDKENFYHVLDWNFDHAVLYNSEQVSGMLILKDTPKNNPMATLPYPIINPTSIDILFDKVEQKYRFNQFWDITADRGEYTFPNVQRPIWNTESNGYIRSLNPANLNYNKAALQRKKFRHYANHVLLYKNVSNNVKMLLKLVNNKNLYSPR